MGGSSSSSLAPPPYQSEEKVAVSVHRSQAEPAALQATANTMLGATMLPTRSMSLTDASLDNVRSMADSMLRASAASSRPHPQSPQSTGSSWNAMTPTSTPSSSSFSSRPQSQSSSSRPQSSSSHRSSSGNPFRLSLRGSVSSLRESLSASLRAESSQEAALSRAQARERVRAAEAKTREMEQLVERLKRESQMGPSATEAELRLLQLKYESMKAGSEATPRTTTEGLFKASCSTDLLFLIDVTGSMQAHIDNTKSQVKAIVGDIKQSFFLEADVRVAVIGYRDHTDKKQLEFLDFTADVGKVYSFLDELKAMGGKDPAEDVLSGLQRAITASWQHETRCVFHIADAPPHGRALHDMDAKYDDYIEAGSEPHNLHHEDLLAQMVRLRLNYVLMRINSHTDRMALVFLEAYAGAAPDAKLLARNKYCKQAEAVRQKNRGRFGLTGSAGGLHFEEVELGTQYSALRHLVVRSVAASASRTAVRMSTSSRRSGKSGLSSGLSSGRSSEYPTKLTGARVPALEKVSEDDEAAAEIELEEGPPRWDKEGWLDQTERFKAFSTDVTAAGVGIQGDADSTPLLDRMMASDDNIRISTTELVVRRRSRPFAQGAMRVAAYARTQDSTTGLVVKSFKAGGKQLADLAEEMRVQALCKAFALEFNNMVGEAHSLDFTVVTCLQPLAPPSAAAASSCLSLEPLLHGTYVKYNSNCGGVNDALADDPFGQAAQAFSHFTFERSQGRFLIADLQGVDHVLTDPAVHTRDHTRFVLTDTNLNEEGFKFFFATHRCNDVCKKLALVSNVSMFLSSSSSDFAFRTDWSAADGSTAGSEAPNMRVCCANKLCSRIVRVATAKSSGPGFYWCDACFPQLDASSVKMLCLEPGTPHEFDVSRFFYESQGRILPRLCTQHRGHSNVPDYTPTPPPSTPARSLFRRH